MRYERPFPYSILPCLLYVTRTTQKQKLNTSQKGIHMLDKERKKDMLSNKKHKRDREARDGMWVSLKHAFKLT